MEIDLTIKNYRCFVPDVTLRLRPGFTAFVGVNNSGKSAILRLLYEFRPLLQQLTDGDKLALLKTNHRDTNMISGVQLGNFSNLNEGPIRISMHSSDDWKLHLDLDRFSLKCAGSLHCAHNQIPLSANLPERPDLNILLRVLCQTLYIPSFRNALSGQSEGKCFDLFVGKGFTNQWRQFQTGDNNKNNEAAFQLTEHIRGMLGFDTLAIAASQDLTHLKLIINGRSNRLDEVGSGVAQLILGTMNAAVQRPEYIMIDEPELNLHPSLQIDFLTTLGQFAKSGVFFATHSLGLARAVADRIYVVEQTEGRSTIRQWESVPHLSELLGSLSYSGYQQLGFEKVLLVEGPTDVRTVQQFLRFYKKEHQVVLLPLCGDSLINAKCQAQLEEIKRITEHVFALVDSEKESEDAELKPSRQGFVEACEKAGINVHVTKFRATENYFPAEAIQKVMTKKHRALKPFERLKDVDPHWPKNENWRIAWEMSSSDLKGTDVGDFLEAL